MDTAGTSTSPSPSTGELPVTFAPRLPPPPPPALRPLEPAVPVPIAPSQRAATTSAVPLARQLHTFQPWLVPPPPLKKRSKAPLGLFLLVLLIAGAGVAWRVYQHRNDEAAPREWDPRIAPLAGFVEMERGLTFDHPVTTNFLPEADFVALFDRPEASTPADQQQAQAATDMYSALGLASGGDVSATNETIDQVSILGFYDPEVDEIYVRGDQLTADVRTVLVHELTHALQAQHFEWQLGGPDDLQVRSVIEADALRIEDLYVDSLPVTEQQQSDEGTSMSPSAEGALAEVPWAMMESQFAPYVLGPSFLEVIAASGGNAAVDAAIQSPPNEEELLDPWRYLLHHATEGAIPNQVAVAPTGTIPLYQSSPFGLFDAMVMLDAWLPWQQTRRALDGWNGGAMVVYELNGQVCTTIAIGQEDDAGAQRLAAAVTAWSAASGSTAQPTVGLDGAGRPLVSFSPCERPAGAPIPASPTLSTSYELAFENSIVSDALDGATGTSTQIARCAARLLIDDPAFNELAYVAELTPEQDERLRVSANATLTWCTNDPTAVPER